MPVTERNWRENCCWLEKPSCFAASPMDKEPSRSRSLLSSIRIEESKLLLRDGSLSMGEAAKQLGFSSQQQFSRQFRSVTGMTPSEYVKTLR